MTATTIRLARDPGDLPAIRALIAVAQYRCLGFVETPRYNDNPLAEPCFMALDLDGGHAVVRTQCVI